MNALTPQRIEPWAPDERARPILDDQTPHHLTIRANGTGYCAGGYLLRVKGIQPGQSYRVRVEVTHSGLHCPRDNLVGILHWGHAAADSVRNEPRFLMDYLAPVEVEPDRLVLERRAEAPAGANELTIRYGLRWSRTGESRWSLPQICELPPEQPQPVRVSVVTGVKGGFRRMGTIAKRVAFYARHCRAACDDGAQLLVLPEVCLQWLLPGTAYDKAIPVPGPELAPLAEVARQFGAHIIVGVHEREEDAVYNTAALIGPDGGIAGRYHKVQLAVQEALSGVMPGEDYPVWETAVGRIGCNICMDSSVAEASRLVGLGGADFLCMPIMGDNRASAYHPGQPRFCEDRWKAIMRTRAMDNQLCMVVARNNTEGSCIIDRRGDIVAWNGGNKPWVSATVEVDGGYRIWNGAHHRDVCWMGRRPHLYGAIADPWCMGALDSGSITGP